MRGAIFFSIATAVALLFLVSNCGNGHNGDWAGHRLPTIITVGDSHALNPVEELAALETPSGVDPLLFQQLKSALATALADNIRTASTPPSGTWNTIDDFRFEPTEEGWRMKWSYQNAGDYDNDTIVSVSDLTVLARHWGEDATDPTSIASVCDTSGNGVVDVADITAIAQNYCAQCSGYYLLRAASPEGPFEMGLGYESSSFIGEGRKTYDLNCPEIGYWYQVVPFNGDHATGQASNPAYYTMEGFAPIIMSISPPFASAGYPKLGISAEVQGAGRLSYVWWFDFPEYATGGQFTNFESATFYTNTPGIYDAWLLVSNEWGTDRYDFTVTADIPPALELPETIYTLAGQEFTLDYPFSGAEPDAWSWDFGDGATPGTSTDRNPTITIGEPGRYDCSLTMESPYSSGDPLEFTMIVNAAEPWHYAIADNANDAGQHLTSAHNIAEDANYFVYGVNQGEAYYIREKDGVADAPVLIPAPPAGDIEFTSIAVSGAVAAELSIAYTTEGQHDCYFATSSTSFQPDLVSSGIYGEPALVVDQSNNPYVFYRPHDAGNPDYPGLGIMCATKEGGNWVSTKIYDFYAAEISAAIDSQGVPHIAFSAHFGDIASVRHAYLSGSEWVFETAAPNDEADYLEIAMSPDGTPCIAYAGITQDNSSCFVRYATRGESAWSVEQVDAPEMFIGSCSLAIDGLGTPHIAYTGGQGWRMQYAVRGEQGWDIQAPDWTYGRAGYAAIEIEDVLNPVIAYSREKSDMDLSPFRLDLAWRE